MALQNIPLGGTTKENLEKINSNFGKVLATDNNVEYTPSHDYEPATKKYVDDSMSGAGLGDMLKSVYDQNNNNIVDNAERVDHTLTVKINSGTTEGNSQYTFDGSATKSLDIKAGSNVSITTANGEATIAATDTNTVTRLKTGDNPDISSSFASGDITLGEASAKQVSTSIGASPDSTARGTLPTLGAVKDYVDSEVTANRYYKGVIDASSIHYTPAANAGDVYVISVAGTINGISVDKNDTLICNHNGTEQATSEMTPQEIEAINGYWDIIQGNIDGAVTTSDTAAITSGTVPIYDDTTGKVIHSSGFTLGKSVPANAAFTDTVPVAETFTSDDNRWGSKTGDVFPLTISNVDDTRYPVAVFNNSGAQVMVGITKGAAVNNKVTITIESYDKFAGYVVLV